MIHLGLADGLGYGALHAALLDAVVDDARHIIGQSQIGVGLDEEQRYGDQDHGQVWFKTLRDAA